MIKIILAIAVILAVSPASAAFVDTPPALINVKGSPYYARGDGRIVTPIVGITNSGNILTTNSPIFTSSDIGKTIIVANAGTAPTTGPIVQQPVLTPGNGYTGVPSCSFTDSSSSGSGATCQSLMTLQSATLVSGGTGCTASGTFVFMTAIDSTGTAAQVSATTNSSGVVTGSLTIVSPGLVTAFGTLSGANIYGANCATAPTVNLSYGVGAVLVSAEGTTYSTTQTSGALTGGSPSVAATLGTTAIGAPIPPLVTTIASYISPTKITLVATAGTTISSASTQLLIATDDSAAFQAAENAGSGIFIPAGTYYIGTTQTIGVTDVTIMGAGLNQTILVHDAGPANAISALFQDLSFPVPAWNGSVELEDFQIRGLLDFGRVNTGAAMVILNDQLEIREDRMKFYQVSNMAQANELTNRFIVQDSIFDTVMRDQARCRSCFNILVKDNTFRHSDDDSVALHQYSNLNLPGEVRAAIVVEGNTFEDTTGIHILGAREVVVAHNTCRRMKLQCVNVTYDASEGIDQIRSVTITNNTSTDLITRIPLTGGGTAFNVGVEPGSAPTGATNFIPGGMIKGTGYIGRPWDFDLNNVVNGTQLAGQARGVTISDNVEMRTLPATPSYATWGFGSMLTNYGFYDQPVTDTALRPSQALTFSINISGLKIANNRFYNTGYCMESIDTGGIPEEIGFQIIGNTCYDTTLGGIALFGAGTPRSGDIIANDIDVDPYQLSAGRSGATGAWTNGYSSSACLSISESAVINLTGNTFSNCYSISQQNTWRIKSNIVRGIPFNGNTGQINSWSSANQGIGVFPIMAGDMFFLSPVVSNPSGGNTPNQWGALTTTHIQYAAAVPSSGYHVIGDIIWSTAPTTCTCAGWVMLTTGSAWVHNTDYDVLPIN